MRDQAPFLRAEPASPAAPAPRPANPMGTRPLSGDAALTADEWARLETGCQAWAGDLFNRTTFKGLHALQAGRDWRRGCAPRRPWCSTTPPCRRGSSPTTQPGPPSPRPPPPIPVRRSPADSRSGPGISSRSSTSTPGGRTCLPGRKRLWNLAPARLSVDLDTQLMLFTHPVRRPEGWGRLYAVPGARGDPAAGGGARGRRRGPGPGPGPLAGAAPHARGPRPRRGPRAGAPGGATSGAPASTPLPPPPWIASPRPPRRPPAGPGSSPPPAGWTTPRSASSWWPPRDAWQWSSGAGTAAAAPATRRWRGCPRPTRASISTVRTWDASTGCSPRWPGRWPPSSRPGPPAMSGAPVDLLVLGGGPAGPPPPPSPPAPASGWCWSRPGAPPHPRGREPPARGGADPRRAGGVGRGGGRLRAQVGLHPPALGAHPPVGPVVRGDRGLRPRLVVERSRVDAILFEAARRAGAEVRSGRWPPACSGTAPASRAPGSPTPPAGAKPPWRRGSPSTPPARPRWWPGT